METNYISVSQLNFYLYNIIEGEELLKNMYLVGEVSGVSASGNNLYFTIKDEYAQLPACCFNYTKTYTPQNGEKVLMRGSPNFYQKGGRISFIAQHIEPQGLGKLHLELEKLKKKLAAEGLFEAERKKPLPRFPLNICVITSINGAVVNDIISTIRKYNKIINITVMDTKVQGEGAASDIIRCLETVDKEGFDCIILARGGGSFEDLLPFSDERLIRTVSLMKTVLISAVGHETDYTLVDFVSDARALTPTAGAELVAFDTSLLTENIRQKAIGVGKNIEKKIEWYHSKTKYNARDIYFICKERLNRLHKKIQDYINDIAYLSESKINEKEQDLRNLVSKLSLLNPVSILEKGYFKIMKDNKDMSRVAEFEIGDNISVYGSDGRFTAKVLFKDMENEK